MKSNKTAEGRYARVRPSVSKPGKFTVTVKQDGERSRVRLDLAGLMNFTAQANKLIADAVA